MTDPDTTLHEADLLLLPLADDIIDGEAILRLPEACREIALSEDPREALTTLAAQEPVLGPCLRALLALVEEPLLGLRQHQYIPVGGYLLVVPPEEAVSEREQHDPDKLRLYLQGAAEAFLGVLADLGAGRVDHGEEALGVITALLDLIPPPQAAVFAAIFSGEFPGRGQTVMLDGLSPRTEEDFS